ncbi:Tripartite tricarboxylate transporter family receptor [Pigmentiphaga humi]|uniref:Tripartite tricarboxylate transporter family receptor n=1 Tax=Pigmentiphaga humi TaxID=2478468 RepID=A0A3P4AX24_9BURK|nr:tripartite tricarboxylate transporter substrate binding protein [Pigmentiphaga humi]VCU68071.1 Tripartite tricarboxylate transporter family receptor [Pigmentiphaga humi]
MNSAKKLFALFLSIAGLPGGQAAHAQAQAYPSRPITWVSPWTAGGGNDILSRALAEQLSSRLGQTVVVENRPGATGTIGTAQVARAAPDGYTLTLASAATHATAPAIYSKLSYDPVKDFTPITLVATVANVLVVHPSVPAANLKELIAYAKAHPNQLNYSSVGAGSIQHLSGVMFNQLAGVETAHVPYKGTAPAVVDLLAGRVQMAFESLPTMLPHIRSGALRAIGVTTSARSQVLPELPTLAEAGLPGFDASLWYAVMGPAGIPEPVVKTLHDSVVASLKTPEVMRRLSEQGADLATSTPAELAAFVRKDTEKWAGFIKRAGVKLD